ncbi:MAG TPA: hypothetical protein VKA08_13145 [Balneolales bacterium]|nr:hypothetical protein [Balneolales bacterium]
MKTKRLLRGIPMLGLVAVIVTGCITSVHPLFTDKELIFRPELIGTWQNDNETMVFRGIDSTHYSVLYVEKTDTTELIGRLGKLGDHYYLDMTIDPHDQKVNDLLGTYIFPVHIFFKVSFENGQLNMNAFAFSSDWLEKLIQERRIRIKHEVENDQVLLTASTEELQKFVIKYADEPKAFDSDPSSYKRITAP